MIVKSFNALIKASSITLRKMLEETQVFTRKNNYTRFKITNTCPNQQPFFIKLNTDHLISIFNAIKPYCKQQKFITGAARMFSTSRIWFGML